MLAFSGERYVRANVVSMNNIVRFQESRQEPCGIYSRPVSIPFLNTVHWNCHKVY